MVQYSNSAKNLSEKDGTILKQCQNLSTVRKRWYNTQTVPKPVNSQKKMVQYSNRAETCQQSEKDGTILRAKNLSTVRKRRYNTQTLPKTCQQSEKDGTILRAETCQQSEKDGTILESKKPVNSQEKMVQYSNSGQKPVNSQKKMVQYSNSAKNLSTVRKRWYNTQTVPKPVNSQKKMVQYSNSAKNLPVNSQKKMVQYSNKAKTCHQSEKDGTILKQFQNLPPVRKRWYNTQTVPKTCLSTVRKRWYNIQTKPKPVTSQKKMVQFSNKAKT